MDIEEQVYDALYNHLNLSSKQLLDEIMELSTVKEALSLLARKEEINKLLELERQGKLYLMEDISEQTKELDDYLSLWVKRIK